MKRGIHVASRRWSLAEPGRAKVLETIAGFVRDYRRRGRAPRRRVAALLGQLVGISPAIPSGAANLQNMHRIASGAHSGVSYGLGAATTVYQFSDASGDAWGFARLAP